MSAVDNANALESVVAGLVDGFVRVYRDHDGRVSFRVAIGALGSPPEECDHIEFVLSDGAVSDLGRALSADGADSDPIFCSVGVRRRGRSRPG
ncbi:hypothetical protein FHS29_000430 [Saccharothrix tamanrassetensis]|uniref:Uncharacterized protein n=1 Tax=Saccharothrix tamanrassetensis TaxID=1051531 RepID=A0A841CA65_9PSEU|nr:hypothetical protein [Saccharothrix tamanrassetensis]MBB5953860.1 hypothetical protein [Saccharothrix tamanrassetensis]